MGGHRGPGFLALGSTSDPDRHLESVALNPEIQNQILGNARDKSMGWVRSLFPPECNDVPPWGGAKLNSGEYAHLVEVVLKLRFMDLIDESNRLRY